jgi:creatinine amidohydrolase
VRFLSRHGVRAVAPMNVLLGAMLDLDATRFADALGHVGDPEERRAILGELARDLHAGLFETSLALHDAPHAVAPEYRALPPCPPVSPRRGLALASRLARALGRKALAAELNYAAWGVA